MAGRMENLNTQNGGDHVRILRIDVSSSVEKNFPKNHSIALYKDASRRRRSSSLAPNMRTNYVNTLKITPFKVYLPQLEQIVGCSLPGHSDVA